jgi:hypothetical protein
MKDMVLIFLGKPTNNAAWSIALSTSLLLKLPVKPMAQTDLPHYDLDKKYFYITTDFFTRNVNVVICLEIKPHSRL